MENIYIERIVLTPQEYRAWRDEGVYLSFEEGLVPFEDACEYCGLELKSHYDNEDDYNEALFEVECNLYWNGYYTYNDDYGFEDASDQPVEWDFIQAGGHWVIIRVHTY